MSTTEPAKMIRQKIGNMGFTFWVRRWRDGATWVGATYGGASRAAQLKARLIDLGYTPTMNGKPGTSGEFIIEI